MTNRPRSVCPPVPLQPTASFSGDSLLNTGREAVVRVRIASLGGGVKVSVFNSMKLELNHFSAIMCHLIEGEIWVGVYQEELFIMNVGCKGQTFIELNPES